MVALYKKKEYHILQSTDTSVLLGSKTQVDSSWVGFNGEKLPYRKMVPIDECTKLYSVYCYGVFAGQEAELFAYRDGKFEVFAGMTDKYSNRFIKEIFNGEKGRDISVWKDPSVFSGFTIRYYNSNEEWKTKKNASLEEVLEKVEKMFG